MKKKTNLPDDALIREISEEVKNDKLKEFWDKNGLYVVILVIVALTAAVSFETFKTWKAKRNQSWSDTYSYALNLENQGKLDDSLKILENIAKTNDGIYGSIAQVQIANILFEKGETKEAIQILEKIAQDKNIDKKMRDVTIVKLASYQLDTAPSEEIKKLLQPLIVENGSWKNIALEMIAMTEIRDGNIPEAQRIYGEILKEENLPEALKFRVQDMLSVLDSSDK